MGIESLIRDVNNGNMRAAGKELDALMKERITDHLNTRKLEVARELMSTGENDNSTTREDE